jgi:predicted PurR-regulated permease PerM
LTIAGFAAILVGEVSSLAQQLPEYRANLESKIRSLPSVTPGGGVFGRAAHMLQELSNELRNSTNEKAAPSAVASAAPAPAAVATKPVSVQIQEPEPGPLQIVRDISSGRCCNPLASAGLVVVVVVMILLDRQDLRDRLLRLAGRATCTARP